MIIKQEEKMGCGVACVAMVLGETYQTARARFVGREFETRGLTHVALDKQLAIAGFAVQRIYPQKEIKAWPPEPFAPIHIARVKVNRGRQRIHHYVLVTNFGLVLDPEGPHSRRSLHEYRRVLDVAGIFPTTFFAITGARRG